MVLPPNRSKKPCNSKCKLRLRLRPPQLRSKSVPSKMPAAKRRRMLSVVARKRNASASKKRKLTVTDRLRKSKSASERCMIT